MEEFLPEHGAFIMRQQVNGKGIKGTMVLGFIPERLTEQDEMWDMEFIITNVKKYKLNKDFQGWQANALLCHKFLPEDLEEIKNNQ